MLLTFITMGLQKDTPLQKKFHNHWWNWTGCKFCNW